MDDMLLEITEILKEAEELINRRNTIIGWNGNRVLNVHIDNGKIDIFMNSLPERSEIVKTSQHISDLDGEEFVIKEGTANGVTFSSIDYVEGGACDAKLAF